ncbi:MAG TPA: hypothetical protein VJZ25_07115 [Gemmatimonadaceae bacterium]|nr:hypothetical protein [Gemmatimonadaceae bacterium]
MLYAFLAGLLLGDLFTVVILLWSRSARGFVRDRLGLTVALTELRSMDGGLRADLDVVASAGVKHWEAIATQLNSNTLMLREMDRLHHHWALANPQLKRIADRLREQDRLTLGRREGAADPGVHKLRCAYCDHPQTAHDNGTGRCRAMACECETFASKSEKTE